MILHEIHEADLVALRLYGNAGAVGKGTSIVTHSPFSLLRCFVVSRKILQSATAEIRSMYSRPSGTCARGYGATILHPLGLVPSHLLPR